MARPLRIEYPDAVYHVSNAGPDRKRVFADAATKALFMQGVEEASQRFNVRVHAWVLLANEYHLLLATPEGNLSRFMRQLDGVFTQNYQRKRGTSGSVFRTRYKAVLLQPERYLAPVSLFLHRLAADSKNADSSLPLYLSAAKGPSWFDKQSVLEAAGLSSRQTAAYKSLLAEDEDEQLARFYGRKNRLSVLGDERFTTRVRKKQGKERKPSRSTSLKGRPSLKEVVSAVARHCKVEEKSIYRAARGPGSRNLPRWMAMSLCQEVAGITLQVIADKFGLKRYGTVSTTIGKLKTELAENPKTASLLKKIRRELTES